MIRIEMDFSDFFIAGLVKSDCEAMVYIGQPIA